MKRGRRKKPCQTVFRKTEYSFDQYWNIAYTEVHKDGSEKDFKTFLKANSYKNAKNILKMKLLEEGVKIKSLQGFMFHADYKGSGNKKLTIKNWQQIKSASYPNENDHLFKHFVERPEGYSNRYNKTNYNHLKKIGFKKGPQSYSTLHRKGKHLPIEKRIGKRWTGAEWVEWDKKEMALTKARIVEALISCNHSRKKAAAYLNMGRTQLYKLMKRISGLEWWNEQYPIIERSSPPRVSKEERSATQKRVMKEMMEKGHKPFGNLTEEQQQKKINNIRKAKKNQAKKRIDYWLPKVKRALKESGNVRSDAAKMLKITPALLKKIMYQTKNIVNWQEEYPSPFYSLNKK